MMKAVTLTLIAIISLGALVRAINLTQPLLEGASTRQVQTAMIARNFYNHGFRLFYPQIDCHGDNPGYLMQEFYVIPFIAALFYKLLGGVNEWVLRLISVFSYVMAAAMIYMLASYYFNRTTALISALSFTVSPLSIYLGRAVHPEMAMIFFNMATIYFFSRWMDEGKFRHGLFSALSFIFSVLLKVPNLYLFLPLAFMAYLKFGRGIMRERRLWAFLIAFGLPVALFNYHQHLVRTQFPNPDMVNFKMDVILGSIRSCLAGKEFYKAVYENLVGYTLTPLGFTLFLLGLTLKVGNRKEYLFHTWVLSVAIFFLMMPGQSWQGYYQMHLLPPACIIIGKLVNEFSESRFCKDRFLRRRVLEWLALSVALLVVFRYSYAYYRVPENFRHVVEAGRQVDRIAETDALVVASIEDGPDMVYYANRRGWPFDVRRREARASDLVRAADAPGRMDDAALYLEELRAKGADYFASASLREFFSNERFARYILEHYRVVKETRDFIIFDIRAKR